MGVQELYHLTGNPQAKPLMGRASMPHEHTAHILSMFKLRGWTHRLLAHFLVWDLIKVCHRPPNPWHVYKLTNPQSADLSDIPTSTLRMGLHMAGFVEWMTILVPYPALIIIEMHGFSRLN